MSLKLSIKHRDASKKSHLIKSRKPKKTNHNMTNKKIHTKPQRHTASFHSTESLSANLSPTSGNQQQRNKKFKQKRNGSSIFGNNNNNNNDTPILSNQHATFSSNTHVYMPPFPSQDDLKQHIIDSNVQTQQHSQFYSKEQQSDEPTSHHTQARFVNDLQANDDNNNNNTPQRIVQYTQYHIELNGILEQRNNNIHLYPASNYHNGFRSELHRNGLLYPSNRLHPAQEGYFDYGPSAALIKENIRKLWHVEFVDKVRSTYLIETPTLTHPTSVTAPLIQTAALQLVAQCKACGETPDVDQILTLEDNQKRLQFEPEEIIDKHHYEQFLSKLKVKVNRHKDFLTCPCCLGTGNKKHASNLSNPYPLPKSDQYLLDRENEEDENNNNNNNNIKRNHSNLPFGRRNQRGFREPYFFTPYVPHVTTSNGAQQNGFFRIDTLTGALENLYIPNISYNSTLPLTIAQNATTIRNSVTFDRSPNKLKENDVVSITTFCSAEDVNKTIENTINKIFTFCEQRLGFRQLNKPSTTTTTTNNNDNLIIDHVFQQICNSDMNIYNENFALKPQLRESIIKTTNPFRPSYQLDVCYQNGFDKNSPLGSIEAYNPTLYQYYYGGETMTYIQNDIPSWSEHYHQFSNNNNNLNNNNIIENSNNNTNDNIIDIQDFDNFDNAYQVDLVDMFSHHGTQTKHLEALLFNNNNNNNNNKHYDILQKHKITQISPYTIHSVLSLDKLTLATLYTHMKNQTFRIVTPEMTYTDKSTGRIMIAPERIKQYKRTFLSLPYELSPYHIMFQTKRYVNITNNTNTTTTTTNNNNDDSQSSSSTTNNNNNTPEVNFFNKLLNTASTKVLWLPQFENRYFGYRVADAHGIPYCMTYHPEHNVCEIRSRDNMKLFALTPEEVLDRLENNIPLHIKI